MRTIRRYGTPVPDTEKGYISDTSSDGNSGSIVSAFKNAFRGNTAEESPRPAIQISHPIPNQKTCGGRRIVEVDGRCEGVFSHTWDYGLAWFGILAVSLVNKQHSLNTVVRKFTNTMTNELIY